MLFALLLACTSTQDDGPLDDSATDDSSPATDDSSAEGSPCEPEDISVAQSGIYGTVTTEGGDPVGCLRAQFGLASCTIGDNNVAGEYSIESGENGLGAFEIFPLSDDYSDYFVAHAFFENDPAGAQNLDVVLQQVEGGWQALPATTTTLDLGEGFSADLGADNWEIPFGTDADTVGAAVLPTGQSLPMTGLDAAPLLAYTLSPFDGHASSGVAFTIDQPTLEDGVSYDVWQMELDTTAAHYEWSRLGTWTASGTTLSGDGLSYLTTVVVTAAE